MATKKKPKKAPAMGQPMDMKPLPANRPMPVMTKLVKGGKRT